MSSELIKPDALRTTERKRDDEPAINRWYWRTEKEKGQDKRYLVCVTHIGSNYVGISYAGPKSDSSDRIHFNDFWNECEYEPDPWPFIDLQVQAHWQRAQELISEVTALTAKLGVSPRQELTDGTAAETQALSLRSGEPIGAYKKALIKAKDKTLPKLFEEIEIHNDLAASWMKTKLIPLRAVAKEMEGSIDKIEDRIFNVELYAGLIEEVKHVRDGKPALLDEPVHVMQRRHYMDEECLVGYETGGMNFENIKDFDKWLAKKKNSDRLLPFPRCVVAFQVRRNRKNYEVGSLADFIQVMHMVDADKMTFIYLRNGEQLFRLSTGIEFGEKLFPDQDRRVLGQGKLWGKGVFEIEDVITDEEYQGEQEEAANDSHHRGFTEYHPFTSDSVRHDDIRDFLEKKAKEHNRLVLVLQGLLDRSPVFHPHPPWQLWTSAGFETGIKLIFDDSRALVPADLPDFEYYRARLNASLTTGSVTVGQEISWEKAEAAKRNRNREFHRDRYRPPNNPGPGRLARVAKYSPRNGACTYTWMIERQTWSSRRDKTALKRVHVTGEENILNVDAYTPGDFHMFFDDPRTRMQYLQWAPLLLEAEECHAGNRDIKPGPRLKPLRKARVRRGGDEDRPADLRPEPKPKPPKDEQYNHMFVELLRNVTTRGGVEFKHGEILEACYYHRKRVDLFDPKDNGRRISGIHITDVRVLGPAKKEK